MAKNVDTSKNAPPSQLKKWEEKYAGATGKGKGKGKGEGKSKTDTKQNSGNRKRQRIPQEKWDEMKEAGINVYNIKSAGDLEKAEELMAAILANRQNPNQEFVLEDGKKSKVNPIFRNPEYKHLLSTKDKDKDKGKGKQKSTAPKQDKKQGKDRKMTDNKLTVEDINEVLKPSEKFKDLAEIKMGGIYQYIEQETNKDKIFAALELGSKRMEKDEPYPTEYFLKGVLTATEKFHDNEDIEKMKNFVDTRASTLQSNEECPKGTFLAAFISAGRRAANPVYEEMLKHAKKEYDLIQSGELEPDRALKGLLDNESNASILEIIKRYEDKVKVNDDNTKDNGKSEKPLTVDTAEEKKENQNNLEIPEWVKRKMEAYQAMADKGDISNYKHNAEITDGFAASFNDGGIHYTSPDNVSVAPGSGLKVFETLVTEPDNKGRTINFGDNMSHEQAVLLMTAAIINGNPLGSNIPQLTPDDLKKIEQEILKERPEDFKKFKEGLEKYQPKQNQQEANQAANQPQGLSEEKKGQVKEALSNQYELAKLQSIKNPVFQTAEARNEHIAKVKDLTEKQETDKKLLIEVFRDNPAEFRSLLNEVIKEKTGGKLGGLNQEQVAGQAAVRQSQIDALREKMSKTAGSKEGTTQLDEHAAKEAERTENREIMKAKLGINKDGYTGKDGTKHEPLVGKELDDYIKDKKVTEFLYNRLGGQDKDVAKTCADKNPIIPTKGNERQ